MSFWRKELTRGDDNFESKSVRIQKLSDKASHKLSNEVLQCRQLQNLLGTELSEITKLFRRRSLPVTVSSDYERAADALNLAAQQVEVVRRALLEYRSGKLDRDELSQILDRLLANLKSVYCIPRRRYLFFRPLRRFQKNRESFRKAFLEYYRLESEEPKKDADPIEMALTDRDFFSKEFSMLEIEAVRLRDLLRKEANKLYRECNGAIHWIADKNAFTRKWSELVASATLGFVDVHAEKALSRVNAILTALGIENLDIDIRKLTQEDLKKVFRAAAKHLHPDKTKHIVDKERKDREGQFKELEILINALHELLIKAKGEEK